MNTGEPIRIGLIGAGNVVEKVHAPILRSLAGVDIRWAYDRDISRARKVSGKFGIPSTPASLDECGEVDVALVATPAGTRRAVLEKVLPRGWHLFCEKPFATTVADHEWFLAESRRRGVCIGVGLMRRYYDTTLTARQILDSRVLGEIELIIAAEGGRVRRTGRERDWYQSSPTASGGGVLIERGSHLVDQAFFVCRVESCEITRCSQRVLDDLELETHAEASIRLAGGGVARCVVLVTRLSDVYNGIVIRGKTGEVRLGPDPEGTVELFGGDGAPAVRASAAGAGVVTEHAAIGAEWESFLASIREGSPLDTGLLTTAFIEDCYRTGSHPDE